ncbi:MAG: acetyl-CoA carboxylase biotin carboxyl carrier protein [Clostridiales bacterium]|nr:acetyl-CoA carboxylase biotin carboxyl carrier protein [Clostridiales bacterium]MDY4181836.1 acetyl-CoA carboxylase biotin carboxyl carrier protein [Pseudoflavonifractor sp.]
MELNDIFALMDRLEGSSLTRLELEDGDFKLVLDRAAPSVSAAAAPAPVPAAAPVQPIRTQEAPPEGTVIRAPLVGTFYAASAPGAAPFAPVGTAVKKGQTVCILEAMKMMSEVPAPADGVIAEVLAADGELVGFDQPLFRLK